MQLLEFLAGVQSQIKAVARLVQNGNVLFLFYLYGFILEVLYIAQLFFDFFQFLAQVVFLSVQSVSDLLLEVLFSRSH
jgi:hypothetical protein